MHLIYRPTILTKGLVCLFCVLFSNITVADEIPCGERRLFKDGTELTSTYDAAYHYLENGSVSMKDGFVAKPGFSIKPSVNCSQTRPALEELVRKYAPEIRFHPQEEFFPTSIESYLPLTKMVNVNPTRVDICWPQPWPFPDICVEALDHLEEKNIITTNVTTENIDDHLGITNPPPALTLKDYSVGKSGDLDSSRVYVHVQPAYYQNGPFFNDDIEIQYWIFYPWNGGQGINFAEHEGDWELISLIVDANGDLKNLFSSAHDVGNNYTPDQMDMVPGTNHPIFYVAYHSHAIYNSIGSHTTYAGVDLDHTAEGGEKLQTWQEDRNEVVSVHSSMINHAMSPTNPKWLKFNGYWGTHLKGPQGPQQKWHIWSGEDVYYNHEYKRTDALPAELIEGNHTICSVTNQVYDLAPPTTSLLTWGISNEFDLVGQSGESITVTPKTSSFDGGGDVWSTVKKSFGGYDIKYAINRPVWFGKPKDEFSIRTETMECGGNAVFEYSDHFTPSSFNWTTTGPFQLSSTNERGVGLTVPYGIPVGEGDLIGTIENQCGALEKSVHVGIHCAANLRVSKKESEAEKPLEEPKPILLINYQLFPNPTTGEVKIGLVSDGQPLTNIRTEVFNYSGRKVDFFTYDKLDSPYLTLDLSSQEKGIYLVRVFQEEVPVFENKIIKQ